MLASIVNVWPAGAMLPEFPKAKKRTSEVWIAAVTEGMRSDTLLAGIPIRVQKEGRRATVDGAEIDYVCTSTTTTIQTVVGRGQSVEDFFSSAAEIGKQMGEQQVKYLFSKVLEQPSAAFQSFSFGPEATIDDILGVWDKMFVRFKGGQPQWPQITTDAAGVERLQKIIEESMHDPVSRAKWQALVDKKLLEYNEREARRRLVD